MNGGRFRNNETTTLDNPRLDFSTQRLPMGYEHSSVSPGLSPYLKQHSCKRKRVRLREQLVAGCGGRAMRQTDHWLGGNHLYTPRAAEPTKGLDCNSGDVRNFAIMTVATAPGAPAVQSCASSTLGCFTMTDNCG